jgi:predicted anti-sigma-YlaC factor YlaD
MTCTEFLAILDDFFDESIAAETRAEIEKHMQKCEHCEVVFNTTRKTIEIYRSHEIYELSPDLRERLHSAIMDRCAKKKRNGC